MSRDAIQRLYKEREKARLNSFMTRESPEDQELLNQALGVTKKAPPVAEEQLGPFKPRKGAIEAGRETVSEITGQAYVHAINALNSVYKASYDPNATNLDDVSAAGEAILAGMKYAVSLPMGIGVAIGQGVSNYFPGIETSNWLPAFMAAAARGLFVTPEVLLDPEIRRFYPVEAGGDPKITEEQRKEYWKHFADELYRPMTGKEVIEIVGTMFGPSAFLGGARALRRRGRKREGAETAPERVAPEPDAPFEIPPETVPPPEGITFRPFRQKDPEAQIPTAQSIRESLRRGTQPHVVAETRGKIVESLRRGRMPIKEADIPLPEPLKVQRAADAGKNKPSEGTATTKETLAEKLRTIVEEAQKIEPGRKGERPRGPGGQFVKMGEALDAATKVAEKVIEAEVAKDPKLSTFIKRQEAAPPAAAPAAPAYRVQRGKGGKYEIYEGDKLVETVASRSAAREYIRAKEGEAALRREVKGRERRTDPRTGEIFDIDIATGEVRTIRPPSPPSAVIRKPPGEAGHISIELLARLAVSAAVGGTQGETAGERVAYGLATFFGWGMARRMARRMIPGLANDVRARQIMDPNNPVNPMFKTATLDAPTARVVADVIGQAAARKIDIRGLKTDIQQALALGPDSPPIAPDILKRMSIAESRVWEYVHRLATEVQKGTRAEDGTLKVAIALARVMHDNVHAQGKRLGGTGARGLDRVRVAYASVNKLAKEWSPGTPERDIASQLLRSRSIEEVGLFTRLNHALPEGLTQIMYNHMLFGEALVKNALGVIPMMILAPINRTLATIPGYWRVPKTKVHATEGLHGAIAMGEALVDQFRLIRNPGRWEALGRQAEKMGSTRMEVTPRGLESISEIFRDRGRPGWANFFDWMNSYANLAPGILQRTDGMSKVINTRFAMRVEAMQKATAEGLARDGFTESFWNRVRNLERDYSQFDADALLRIHKFGNDQVFTRPFENPFLLSLQRGFHNPWFDLIYRLTALPFVRTPWRLMEGYFEYTPGLHAASTSWREKWWAGGVSRSIAEAEIATSIGIFGAFAWLAAQGLITGSEPRDIEAQRTMRHLGRPPNSMFDLKDWKYRSMRGIEPVTGWAAAAADIVYLYQRMPRSEWYRVDQLVYAYGFAVMNNINITQFMQTISEFMEVAKSGRNDKQWQMFTEYARRRLTAFSPAYMRELFTSEKPRSRVIRDVDMEEKATGPIDYFLLELQALIDEFGRQSGGWIGGKVPPERLEIESNMFTGELVAEDAFPFNPFVGQPNQYLKWGDKKLPKWAEELQRHEGAGIERPDQWIGRPQSVDLGFGPPPEKQVSVKLDAVQMRRRTVLMTQIIEIGGNTLVGAFQDLVTSDRYKEQDDVVQRRQLKGLWLAFLRKAEEELVREDESLWHKLHDRADERTLQFTPHEWKSFTKDMLEMGKRIRKDLGPGVAP